MVQFRFDDGLEIELSLNQDIEIYANQSSRK